MSENFNVGDKIAHPTYGAGVIESIEKKEILGECNLYYILKISTKDMKVMVPTSSVNQTGIRSIINKEDCDKVLSVFSSKSSVDDSLNANWNQRYRENLNRLKGGNLYDVAKVVKTLIKKERIKGLSTGEKNMLTSAKQILYSEIVLSKNVKQSEIEEFIENVLND